MAAQPSHIKTYIAPTAIGGRLLVKAGSADGEVVVATNATAPILGVTERIGTRDNARVDVIKGGIAECEAGGNITRGNPVTADSNGKVVAATADGAYIIGYAEVSAADGDFIPVWIAPSKISVPE